MCSCLFNNYIVCSNATLISFFNTLRFLRKKEGRKKKANRWRSHSCTLLSTQVDNLYKKKQNKITYIIYAAVDSITNCKSIKVVLSQD